MQNVWVLASLWVGLALVATLLAIWFRISTALTEIVVGTVAQLIFGAFIVQGGLAAKSDWISFLAGTGAIVLTFLAGAELDPAIFRTKWKESTVIGLSTGLTFGTISALFGLNHGIIDQAQYSYLVATVIGSAVIPTMIANAWFMPRHLLLESRAQGSAVSRATTPGAEGELPWNVEPDDAV